MEFTPLTDQVSMEENLEKHYNFYEGDTSMLRVEEGMFTLFFPEDLHRPDVKSAKI
jgi:beta-galactosidase beta subunit